ncbi:hypothetical protein BH10CHL1_BH10CHL1_15730 [soil metagenome]
MSFTIHSTVRQVLANPTAREILERHVPGAAAHPQLDLAMDLSLREVSMYPESGVDREKLQALLADLAKIPNS